MELVIEFFQKYFFSKRAGSVIRKVALVCVLALSLSVASLVIVMSVMTALNTKVRERTLVVEPQLWVELPSGLSFAEAESHELFKQVSENPAWKIQAFEQQDVVIKSLDGPYRGAVARGKSKEDLVKMLSSVKELAGQQPTFVENFDLEPQEVIMGSDLALSLKMFEGEPFMVLAPESLLLPLGESPRLTRLVLKRALTTQLTDVDANSIFYVPSSDLGEMSRSRSRKVGLEIWGPDPFNIKADFQKTFKPDPSLKLTTWQERNSSLFQALRTEKFAIGSFLGLASLIASFSMITAVALLISQKRKEIGILLTIGYSTKNIMRLFAQLGFALGFVGLVTGLSVGAIVSLYLEKNPLQLLPDVYYDSQIPAELKWSLLLLIFCVGVVLTAAGAWSAVQSLKGVRPVSLLKK